jgi:glycine/D-amino acid oxidase-like deaminating enzyme
MRPVWDSTLDRESLAALDPGPGALDRTPDVLVVGGGAVGLAAAVMCRRAGIERVCVIERDRLASGPSGSAAGGLSPGVHEMAKPPAFGALARRGLELHRALDAEWGGALGLRTLDWVIASSEPVTPGALAAGVELVDAGGARAVEPALGELGGGVVVRDQAWVNPFRLAGAMAHRAGAAATGVAMTGLRARRGRVIRVETTAGVVSPGAVVLATGTAPDGMAGPPVRGIKGHLLVTEPVPFAMRAAVASSVLVVPLADRRLLAGGTFEPGDDEPVVRDDVVAAIRAEIGRLLPAAREVKVEAAWCCFRPGTPDEMPVIDRVADLDNAWLSLGHYRTGLLVAPAAGEALAAWIATGKPAGDLGAFRLDRFD